MRFVPLGSFFAMAALAGASPQPLPPLADGIKYNLLETRYVNGHCSASGSSNGICISTSSCASYGGISDPGSPGAYTCPFDGDDIQCCTIIPHCPGKGSDTLCTWRDLCNTWWTGNAVVLPDPICPGGDDFVCCDING